MWVVYFSAPYAGSWGHTYFREYENALLYYDSKVVGYVVASVHIEEIETED